MDTIIPQKRCYKCPEGQQWHDATPENFGPDKRTTDKLRNCCRSCRHTEYEESLKRNPDLNKDKYQHLLQSPDSLIKHKIRQSVNRKRYYAEAREKGLCPNCGALCAIDKVFCNSCQSKMNELNVLGRIKLREQVLEAYGGVCKCCGESTPEFLAIDHIFNDGKEQRKTISSGFATYIWLKKQGFPQDRFQLLCHNCNWGKRLYGVCPHQRKPLTDHLP